METPVYGALDKEREEHKEEIQEMAITLHTNQ